MRHNEISRAIQREIDENHPGASLSFERTRRHFQAVIHVGGKTLRCTFAGTASDYRASKNAVALVRRQLRSIHS